MTSDTIFGKIISGEIPCDEVYSDEKCLAFKDIEPQAPFHILIIPKKAISSLNEVAGEDAELLGHLLVVAKKIANEHSLDSWRTVINTGQDSGQTVFHLHVHLIGGRALTWPPG